MPKANPKDKNKRFALSDKSKEILEKRKRATQERNPAQFLQFNKEFTESRKQDKKERILESVSKDLDLRERWLGIRELKRKYNPTPYHNKDKDGQHITHDKGAQLAQNT